MIKLINYIFDKNRVYRIKSRIAEQWFRERYIDKFKKNIRNHKFTIISSDCVGGLFYHDLGVQFLSPTINMAIPAPDFIKLCENLNYYMKAVPIEDFSQTRLNKANYPILKLEDIYLHCIHYHTGKEAIEKWEERKKRINWENIFMIFSAKDGFDESILERIDRLPYSKVLYSNKKYSYEWCCYLPDSRKQDNVGDLTRYKTIFGIKRYEARFDIIKWINGEKAGNCIK